LFSEFNLFQNLSIYLRQPEMEKWLAVWEVRFLALALLLLTLCLPALWKIFKTEWERLAAPTRRNLLLVILLALALRLFLPPGDHRLFFDEDLYLNLGQNISKLGLAQNSQFGETFYGNYKNFTPYLNKETNGFPFLVSLIFSVFGVQESAVFLVLKILGGLMVIPVFGIGLLMFGESVGIWAALLFALLPLHIYWSASASSEPACAFFAAWAGFLPLLMTRHRETALKIAAVAVLAFAIQCRIEGVILVIPVLVILAVNPCKLKFSQLLGLGGLLLFLIFPYLLHFNYVRHMDWEASSGQKMALRYVELNLGPNLQFFWANRQFPLLYTLLLLLGILAGINKYRLKNTFALAVWALTFFIPYLFFYAGSYKWGVNVRFAVFLLAPLTVLAASGLVRLLERLENIFPRARISTMALLVIFLQFIPLINQARTPYEDCWDARAEHRFVTEFCRELPENCFVVTSAPAVVLLTGKGAVETTAFTDELLKWMKNRRAQVYLLEDYWSSFKTYRYAFLKVLRRYNFTPVKTLVLNTRVVRAYRLNYPVKAESDIR